MPIRLFRDFLRTEASIATDLANSFSSMTLSGVADFPAGLVPGKHLALLGFELFVGDDPALPKVVQLH